MKYRLMNRPPHIALVLAGGQGCRMHSRCPKQFLEIEGEPIIVHTLRAFSLHPDIDAIYAVCADEWQSCVCQWIEKFQITKFQKTFTSGNTSFQSLRNGLEGLAKEGLPPDSFIITHEAVRPLISREVISDNLETCIRHGNATAAIPSEEAYMLSTDGLQSEGFLPRETLFRAQTPQTFSLAVLQEAFLEADRRGITYSQSLYTLMAELNLYTLYISKGETLNFKITVPQDVDIYQALLRHHAQ